MLEYRRFAGTLNSRRQTGTSWFGDQGDIRFRKYLKISNLSRLADNIVNHGYRSWFKTKFWRFSKNQPNLFICDKVSYYTQRQWNKDKPMRNRKFQPLGYRLIKK